MSGRRTGYRSQRRPRVEAPCSTRTTHLTEPAFEAVAAAPQPIDCPACAGRARGCGVCGGLGFLAHEDWATAVQRAFVAACGLVLPCEADEGSDAA